MVTSKPEINVVGVTFDSKLKWPNHVVKVKATANKACKAIKSIRKFFNTTKLLQL